MVWNEDSSELFVFGGYYSQPNEGQNKGVSTSGVYKLKYYGNDHWGQWVKAGTMKRSRDSGNVIYDNEKFVLIGGFDGQPNELWKSTLEKKLMNTSEPAYYFTITKIA